MTQRLPILAIFDLAGTTMQDDGTVVSVFQEVLASEKIQPTSEEIARVRGANKREAFRKLTRDEAQAGRLYKRFVDGIRDRYTACPPREVHGTTATFTWLRQHGVKIALNTGFERGIVSVLVSSLGWSADMIDTIVCGDEVDAGRPAPAMIHEAMRRTGVSDPAWVMVVGDTVLDLQAGTAARAGWVVGVTSGAHNRVRLMQAAHTHLLSSVADIPEILR
jgi:phosphonatase-like hydrolase